jgi:hypothetical protein
LRPDRRPLRAAVALELGLLWGILAFLFQRHRGQLVDFNHFWNAARAVWDGRDPYAVVPTLQLPFGPEFYYPLPSALVLVPLHSLPLHVAGGVFIGLQTAILAYVVTREHWYPLLLFISPSYLYAAVLGQWSPLMLIALLVPAAGALMVLKPNLGLATFVAAPRRSALIGAAVILLASLAVDPRWPLTYLGVLWDRGEQHLMPVALLGGVVLLAALVRWRRSDGRLLVALACVPQTLLWADQLLLWAVPKSRRETLFLLATSTVAFVVWRIWLLGVGAEEAARGTLRPTWPYLFLGMYLPALIMVLKRPNRTDVTTERSS